MITILHDDALTALRTLDAESVQTCVTSPPYWGLRDYGLAPQVWEANPDCDHVWGPNVIAGEGYASGSRRRWQHGAERETEPQQWQATTTQGAFCQVCGAWSGHLGLEPTPDLYANHIVQIFREVRRVLRVDGTLWLNLGDSYASAWACGRRNVVGNGSMKNGKRDARSDRLVGGLKEKDMVGIPWMVAFALRADGWFLRSDIIWAKPNPMPESISDRPTKSHEYIFLLAKSEKYYFDQDAVREPHKPDSLKRYESGFNPAVANQPEILKANKRTGLFGGIDNMGEYMNPAGAQYQDGVDG